MRPLLLFTCVLGLVSAASAQVAEISVGGGASEFGGGSAGTETTAGGPEIKVDGGFRFEARLTLNPQRFFGHEFGYAYSSCTFKLPTSGDVSVPVHQGLYNFLVYATPEGSKIRPFATGGIGFSSFFPPGSSAYYGNQITKFNYNYGGGIKIRVSSMFGIRLDFRQYSTGHPFDFPNQSGRLLQTAFTGGLSFNL